MNLQPTLQNDLILLRPLSDSDYDPLSKAASDPLIWETHPQPNRFKPEVFRHFFKEAMDSNGALVIVDKKINKIIGVTGFYDYLKQTSSVIVGFTFLERKYWGGVYNSEIKKLLINHALSFVKTIYFQVGISNLRAQKSLEKLGATNTGVQEIQVAPTVSLNFYIYKIEKPLQP